MNCQWQATFTKMLIWLTLEVLLSIMGLDTLADYSEFVLERQKDGAPTELISNSHS